MGRAWPLWLSDDVRRHRGVIRAFRSDQLGLVPNNESVMRLKEEDPRA